MGDLEVDVRIEGENVEMCGFYRFQKPGAGNEATMRHEIGTVTGRMESMMAAILYLPLSACLLFPLAVSTVSYVTEQSAKNCNNCAGVVLVLLPATAGDTSEEQWPVDIQAYTRVQNKHSPDRGLGCTLTTSGNAMASRHQNDAWL